MSVRLLAFIFFSSLYPGWSWALTVETSTVFVQHPEHRELIREYYSRFRSVKLSSRRTGSSIASMMLFEEAEQNLRSAGITENEIRVLNSEAHVIFNGERVEAQKRANYQHLVLLAESFSRISVSEAERRLKTLLVDRPMHLQTYEFIKQNLIQSEASEEAIPHAIRLAGNVVLLKVLENLGYDFESKKSSDVLDAFVSNLDEYLLASPALTEELMRLAVSGAEADGQRVQNLSYAWRKAFPRRNRWIEAFRGSRERYNQFIYHPIKGTYLVWVPAMGLPILTIADSVAPSQYPYVSHLIHMVDFGFVAGWIAYRLKLVPNFLRENPLGDLNDKHYQGLTLIRACEIMLSADSKLPDPNK